MRDHKHKIRATSHYYECTKCDWFIPRTLREQIADFLDNPIDQYEHIRDEQMWVMSAERPMPQPREVSK